MADDYVVPRPRSAGASLLASSRTVLSATADSGYGTVSRNSGPSEAADKGKQVPGRQNLPKSSSKFEDLQNRLEDWQNGLEDWKDRLRARAFAKLLRDATDIRSPSSYPQLAAVLPDLLHTYAHRLLSIQKEGITLEGESWWFVMEHRQLVYVKASGRGKPSCRGLFH